MKFSAIKCLATAILLLGVNACAQAPATQPAGGRMGRMGGMGMPAGPRGADIPSPRTDANSQKAHEQLLAKAKAGKIDLYFLGDSITRRWGGTDYPLFLDNFKRNFWGWNAGNFGWGADSLQNIHWRIANGELEDVNPKVIVFLGGTNNLNARENDANVQDIVKGIKAIVKTAQEKAPKATIVLLGITARNGAGYMANINKINAQLKEFADGKTIRFLDVNDKLTDKDGNLLPGMMGDGLHPDLKGYQVIADGLIPLLTELLGPKANEDLAPPPTGDPSATRPLQAQPADPFVPPTK